MNFVDPSLCETTNIQALAKTQLKSLKPSVTNKIYN